MDILIKLLLKGLLQWIKDNPDSAFSRFMTRQRGLRTDVPRMTRAERLASGLAFLLLGALSAGCWLLLGYFMFELRLLTPENPIALTALIAFTFFTGMGILGGAYLLLRVLL